MHIYGNCIALYHNAIVRLCLTAVAFNQLEAAGGRHGECINHMLALSMATEAVSPIPGPEKKQNVGTKASRGTD